MKLSLWISLLALTGGLQMAAQDDAADEPGDDLVVRGAIVPGNEAQGDSPVPVPPLTHYAALWTKSMFTTHDLPMPEAPAGPGFTDQLVLAGIYEVDGAVAAVILDKMTSQIMEARIGSENEAGIRIKSVDAGPTPDRSRIQLQKGTQFGWVSFGDDAGGGGMMEVSSEPAERVPGLSTRSIDPAGIGAPGMTPGAAAAIRAAAEANAAVVPPTPVMDIPQDVSNPPVVIDDIPLPPQ